MEQIFSFGERWNVPFNISSFTSWNYSYHCTHKHSLFVNYFHANICSDKAKQKETFYLFLIVLKNLQLLLYLELTIQFLWNFLLNEALKMWGTTKKKRTQSFVWMTSDSFCLIASYMLEVHAMRISSKNDLSIKRELETWTVQLGAIM